MRTGRPQRAVACGQQRLAPAVAYLLVGLCDVYWRWRGGQQKRAEACQTNMAEPPGRCGVEGQIERAPPMQGACQQRAYVHALARQPLLSHGGAQRSSIGDTLQEPDRGSIGLLSSAQKQRMNTPDQR